jgi:hypothetical protein
VQVASPEVDRPGAAGGNRKKSLRRAYSSRSGANLPTCAVAQRLNLSRAVIQLPSIDSMSREESERDPSHSKKRKRQEAAAAALLFSAPRAPPPRSLAEIARTRNGAVL